MKTILSALLILAITNTAHADQIAGSSLSIHDAPLTGDLVRNGIAILAPELNQILVLQRDGRAVLVVTPYYYTYTCIDPINSCVIR